MQDPVVTSHPQPSNTPDQGLEEQDPGPGLTDDQRVRREDQARARPGPRVEPGPADQDRLTP